jgi:hypothetical protein
MERGTHEEEQNFPHTPWRVLIAMVGHNARGNIKQSIYPHELDLE